MPVYKRKYKSGTVAWSYVFDAPGSTATERRQIVQSGFATKKEAVDAEAARRIEAQRESDMERVQGVTVPVPRTLHSLLEQLFTEYGEKRLAPKTLERYRELAAMLNPELLATPMLNVTALQLSREWNRLLASGGRTRTKHTPRPLSTKTVRNIAGVVSTAYARAIEWGLTGINPVPASGLPTIRKKERLALTPAQQQLLLEAANSDWGMGTFLRLDAATGCRRGEVLALRWADVQDNTISVTRSLSQTRAGLTFKETKTGATHRLTIPASAVRALTEHRAAQDVLRAQFGHTYRTDLDLVFCTSDGQPLRPDSVSAAVSALFKRLKLPKGASLHTLRHTHGSHLLAAGKTLPEVSKRLAHSSVYVTATIYSHVLSGDDSELAESWEKFQRDNNAITSHPNKT